MYHFFKSIISIIILLAQNNNIWFSRLKEETKKTFFDVTEQIRYEYGNLEFPATFHKYILFSYVLRMSK